MFFAACKHEGSEILENVEVDGEQGCSEKASKALEPLVNNSSGSIYQMVTNADGTVSLVGLDPTQLDHLLNIQGNNRLCVLSLLSVDMGRTFESVFLFVHNITQHQKIPECLNLL